MRDFAPRRELAPLGSSPVAPTNGVRVVATVKASTQSGHAAGHGWVLFSYRTMHVFLSSNDSESGFRSELTEMLPGTVITRAGDLLFEAEIPLLPPRMPYLVFARQWLPFAISVQAESIRAWATRMADAAIGVLPDDQPWGLHIEPHYGVRARHHIGARAWHSAGRRQKELNAREPSPDERPPSSEAGRHRCLLIGEALAEVLQKRRRHLLRQLRREPAPFGPSDSLVQVILTAPDRGFLSVAPAPLPFEQRHLLSPFPKGELPPATDKAAPSRAFAKLVEAELRLGRAIQAGETCVDLGASPGSWTYAAVNRGARVIAVDRSPLREDLMCCAQVTFHQGDAFSFAPAHPVDWLICDVIAAPEQSADLLLTWLRRGWCKRFIVTIKLKDSPGQSVLETLKKALPPLTRELFLTRLCANKKEACAFGTAKQD